MVKPTGLCTLALGPGCNPEAAPTAKAIIVVVVVANYCGGITGCCCQVNRAGWGRAPTAEVVEKNLEQGGLAEEVAHASPLSSGLSTEVK